MGPITSTFKVKVFYCTIQYINKSNWTLNIIKGLIMCMLNKFRFSGKIAIFQLIVNRLMRSIKLCK